MNMNNKTEKRPVQVVNVLLLIILAVVFLSGILLHPFEGVLAIKIIHKLSSTLLVIGVIVHVIQHKRGKKNRG